MSCCISEILQFKVIKIGSIFEEKTKGCSSCFASFSAERCLVPFVFAPSLILIHLCCIFNSLLLNLLPSVYIIAQLLVLSQGLGNFRELI